LGSIAAGHLVSDTSLKSLEDEITEYRKLCSDPSSPLTIGFIGHSTFGSDVGWSLFDKILSKHRPEIVQFFAPAVLTQNGLTNIQVAHNHGAKVVCQVGTEADGIEALRSGADCIVAQGTEAGGHGCRLDVGSGTLSLAARIVALVRSTEGKEHIPVLAAGGIVDGRGLAAALALGCDGAVLGTRLWASKEAKGETSDKEQLASCTIGPDQVIRTKVMDSYQNTYSSTPWPYPFDSSGVIYNETIRKWDGKELQLKEELEKRPVDKLPESFVYAGKGTGDISSVESAYDIICRVEKEAADIIKGLPDLIVQG